ncbi:MAG: ABC transporter substrate-binding protein [Bryobacteraceae bacterium]
MNRRSFLNLAPLAATLASCGKTSKLRLALNWKPDPEFGGFYAADYKKHGLDVDILPGGAGTPTVQMVGAGSAEFGMVSGDEIVLARSKGNDVVGVFASFQKNPMAIMVHESRHLKSIADVVQGGTLAIQIGLPFARILKQKYGFDKVKIVPTPAGDIGPFLNDPMFAQQCFLTAEPLAARRKGAKVQTFPVADVGYDPYAQVMAVSGEMLKKQPDVVKAMVAAVREGWRSYLDNPQQVNVKMQALNPSMDIATFNEVAEAEKPLIEAPQLGAMTKNHWEASAQRLKELGDISTVPPVEEYYRSL